jgi:hypothetical protein
MVTAILSVWFIGKPHSAPPGHPTAPSANYARNVKLSITSKALWGRLGAMTCSDQMAQPGLACGEVAERSKAAHFGAHTGRNTIT